MIRRPPRSTRTDTPVPHTTLIRAALLEGSELESGKRGGSSMDFPVQQLLDRMARVYGPQARERGLALRMVPSSQVIHSDPHLLERILGNLLSNAVRYTSEGRILDRKSTRLNSSH